MTFVNSPIPPDEEHGKKSSVFKEYVVPLGTLLLAIVTIFAQNKLPWWGEVAIVVYVLIVAVVLAGPVIVRGIKQLKAEISTRRLQRHFLPKVAEEVRSIASMVASGHYNTLWGVWENAALTVETQSHIRPNRAHFDTLSVWHQNLRNLADSTEPSDFMRVAAEAGSWFQRYASFGVDAYYQFENLLRANQLDEARVREIKQSWNHIRDDHNRKLNNWCSLCQRINAAFGRDICTVYYETLKPLV